MFERTSVFYQCCLCCGALRINGKQEKQNREDWESIYSTSSACLHISSSILHGLFCLCFHYESIRLKEVENCPHLIAASKYLLCFKSFLVQSSVHIIALAAIYIQTKTLTLFSHRLRKPSHLSAQVYVAERSSSSSCTDRRTQPTPWTHWIRKCIDCLQPWRKARSKSHRAYCSSGRFNSCCVFFSCPSPYHSSPSCPGPCMALFGPGRVSGRGQWRSR